jgi:hypothetical protein
VSKSVCVCEFFIYSSSSRVIIETKKTSIEILRKQIIERFLVMMKEEKTKWKLISIFDKNMLKYFRFFVVSRFSCDLFGVSK